MAPASRVNLEARVSELNPRKRCISVPDWEVATIAIATAIAGTVAVLMGFGVAAVVRMVTNSQGRRSK
jgi:hypothetical protein